MFLLFRSNTTAIPSRLPPVFVPASRLRFPADIGPMSFSSLSSPTEPEKSMLLAVQQIYCIFRVSIYCKFRFIILYHISLSKHPHHQDCFQHIQQKHEVRGPHVVTLLNQTPIAESYLAKVVVKNGHQKDMVAMRLNNGHNWKGLCERNTLWTLLTFACPLWFWKLEMAVLLICNCELHETVPELIQQPEMSLELEVPRTGPIILATISCAPITRKIGQGRHIQKTTLTQRATRTFWPKRGNKTEILFQLCTSPELKKFTRA